MTYVFVYGSLKDGYWNHDCLGSSEFVTTCVTPEQFTMYNGAFPYVTDGGEDSIVGELYDCDDLTINRLDGLEGVPNHYIRKSVIVSTGISQWSAIMYIASKRTKEHLEQNKSDKRIYPNEPDRGCEWRPSK